MSRWIKTKYGVYIDARPKAETPAKFVYRPNGCRHQVMRGGYVGNEGAGRALEDTRQTDCPRGKIPAARVLAGRIRSKDDRGACKKGDVPEDVHNHEPVMSEHRH